MLIIFLIFLYFRVQSKSKYFNYGNFSLKCAQKFAFVHDFIHKSKFIIAPVYRNRNIHSVLFYCPAFAGL